MKKILLLLITIASVLSLSAQSIPGADQNIPFLVTCGWDAEGPGSLEICITKSTESSLKNNIVVVNTRFRYDHAERYYTVPCYNKVKYKAESE